MNKIKGVDYFHVDSLLSEDEVMVRNIVREYVDDQIISIIEKHYREEKFPLYLSKPIAAYQLRQEKLVYILTEITKAQLLNLQLGCLKDKDEVKYTQVSIAKRNNCEKALETARIAREILVANGILYEYPVMRHSQNLESVKTYKGTHEMHTLIIGEDITGYPAFD